MNPAERRGTWVLDTGATSLVVTARMCGLMKVPLRLSITNGQAMMGDGGLDAHFVIDASSVDSSNAKRDEHLHTDDFLAVESHPEISVQIDGQAIEEGSSLGSTVTVKGRRVSVPIRVDTLDTSPDRSEVRFRASATVDRRDLGLDKVPRFLIAGPLHVEVDGLAQQS